MNPPCARVVRGRSVPDATPESRAPKHGEVTDQGRNLGFLEHALNQIRDP